MAGLAFNGAGLAPEQVGHGVGIPDYDIGRHRGAQQVAAAGNKGHCYLAVWLVNVVLRQRQIQQGVNHSASRHGDAQRQAAAGKPPGEVVALLGGIGLYGQVALRRRLQEQQKAGGRAFRCLRRRCGGSWDYDHSGGGSGIVVVPDEPCGSAGARWNHIAWGRRYGNNDMAVIFANLVIFCGNGQQGSAAFGCYGHCGGQAAGDEVRRPVRYGDADDQFRLWCGLGIHCKSGAAAFKDAFGVPGKADDRQAWGVVIQQLGWHLIHRGRQAATHRVVELQEEGFRQLAMVVIMAGYGDSVAVDVGGEGQGALNRLQVRSFCLAEVAGRQDAVGHLHLLAHRQRTGKGQPEGYGAAFHDGLARHRADDWVNFLIGQGGRALPRCQLVAWDIFQRQRQLARSQHRIQGGCPLGGQQMVAQGEGQAALAGRQQQVNQLQASAQVNAFQGAAGHRPAQGQRVVGWPVSGDGEGGGGYVHLAAQRLVWGLDGHLHWLHQGAGCGDVGGAHWQGGIHWLGEAQLQGFIRAIVVAVVKRLHHHCAGGLVRRDEELRPYWQVVLPCQGGFIQGLVGNQHDLGHWLRQAHQEVQLAGAIHRGSGIGHAQQGRAVVVCHLSGGGASSAADPIPAAVRQGEAHFDAAVRLVLLVVLYGHCVDELGLVSLQPDAGGAAAGALFAAAREHAQGWVALQHCRPIQILA